MREGSLEAPTRHPIPWQEKDFTDQDKIDSELRRVFDICHGCRRCFNLCDTFPRLFDLIDESESGELDSVDSSKFKYVVDACTLCDMCFMTKCPYVPPHQFNLDFPHLMLRYRAMELKQGKVSRITRQLTETDRNGKVGSILAPFINFFTRRGNKFFRFIIEKLADVDRNAQLPRYTSKPLLKRKRPKRNFKGTATNRKVILYSTCYVNFNSPEIGEAAVNILSSNGVETKVLYPSCCGMPQLEQGDLQRVAHNAKKVASEILPWVENGYDVIALVPSCSLMMKFEWPLILPNDEDIKKLSQATYDVSEYIMNMARQNELQSKFKKIEGGVTLHVACHARAQNMGSKAAELLRLIPDTKVNVVERCSGHGGSWGIMKDNFDTALNVGLPTARKAAETDTKVVVSECPLARAHIVQGIEEINDAGYTKIFDSVHHPIEVLARSCSLEE